MDEQKKKKRLIILLIVAALILLLLLLVAIVGQGGKTKPTEPVQQTTAAVTTQLPSSSATTTAAPTTAAPTTVPPSTVPPTTAAPTEATKPEKPEATKPVPPTTEPEPTETTPSITDPATILEKARGLIRSISGGKEVGSVSDAKRVTVSVSATEGAQVSAQEIARQIKVRIEQEQSQAPVGAFSFDYKLSFVETAGDRHTFRFDYCVTSASQQTPNLSYEPGRLVADVCAYLNGLGKTKYSSGGGGNASSQPVIIPVEHAYETALSIAKAQAESASAQFGSYDFYYAGMTVTTKGGVEKPALLFYIVNK